MANALIMLMNKVITTCEGSMFILLSPFCDSFAGGMPRFYPMRLWIRGLGSSLSYQAVLRVFIISHLLEVFNTLLNLANHIAHLDRWAKREAALGLGRLARSGVAMVIRKRSYCELWD